VLIRATSDILACLKSRRCAYLSPTLHLLASPFFVIRLLQCHHSHKSLGLAMKSSSSASILEQPTRQFHTPTSILVRTWLICGYAGHDFLDIAPGGSQVVARVSSWPGQPSHRGSSKIPSVIYYDRKGNVSWPEAFRAESRNSCCRLTFLVY
jgi:hypothetical protein